jgi:chemosensory pili system protein ChpA (sensor histidine kinase/response regulator)
VAELLIVDDDSDVSWILAEILEAHGHRTRIAADGQEGLDRLMEHAPDAVVLDVEMPKLDGPAMAYRMIVHDAGLEKIPIVLVSGVEGLRALAERVGTPYYISKPFDTGAMVALVERAVTERTAPEPNP